MVVSSIKELTILRVGWRKFPASDTTLMAVGRATHKIFVGLPLCESNPTHSPLANMLLKDGLGC